MAVAKGVGTKMEGPLQFGTIAFGTTKVASADHLPTPAWPGTVTVGTKIGGPSYNGPSSTRRTHAWPGSLQDKSCTLPIEFDPVSVGMHDDILLR